ncbi:MAG: hypothetical protein ISS82_05025 [Nanoarchaeota archaeon]|nr:hypothetical protein [Nanoarchaeota archaeon]
MTELIILPPLIMGAVIGLYELLLIHRDENFRGSHWLSHGLHAVGWAMAAIFIVMNAEFIYANVGFLHSIPLIKNILVFRIGVGLISMIKIHAASAVVKTTVGSSKGMKQTWAHSFVVAGLIVLSPYIWPYLEPLIYGLIGIK